MPQIDEDFTGKNSLFHTINKTLHFRETKITFILSNIRKNQSFHEKPSPPVADRPAYCRL